MPPVLESAPPPISSVDRQRSLLLHDSVREPVCSKHVPVSEAQATTAAEISAVASLARVARRGPRRREAEARSASAGRRAGRQRGEGGREAGQEEERQQPPEEERKEEGQREQLDEERREERDSGDPRRTAEAEEEEEPEREREGELQVISWNVEGKNRLEDVVRDLGSLDVLLLQEVVSPFDAEGHMFVICESACRSCAVIVHQRLGASVICWSSLGRFPEVTLKRRSDAHICLVSPYLPHTRSLLGSWTDELLKAGESGERSASQGRKTCCWRRLQSR